MSVNYRGVEYDELPAFAREEMQKNIELVLNRYFGEHPDVYEAFLKEIEEKRKAKEKEKTA